MEQLIGKTAEVLGLSADTLRYYEKIGLVPRVGKNRSGRRTYSEKDVARLKFVQRTQSIGFRLAEIGQLLKLRENPLKSSKVIRAMAQRKCEDVQKQISTLKTVEAELTLLLNLCSGNSNNCPILDRLDSH